MDIYFSYYYEDILKNTDVERKRKFIFTHSTPVMHLFFYQLPQYIKKKEAQLSEILNSKRCLI